MIFVNITGIVPVKPDWDSISGILKAGTPISADGKIANDGTAIGLVGADTARGAESISAVTSGVVNLNEAAASYGEVLQEGAMEALQNITFLYGGKVGNPAGGSGLPDYSEASDGDVLAIEDGNPAWKEPSGGGGTVYDAGDAFRNLFTGAYGAMGQDNLASLAVEVSGESAEVMYELTEQMVDDFLKGKPVAMIMEAAFGGNHACTLKSVQFYTTGHVLQFGGGFSDVLIQDGYENAGYVVEYLITWKALADGLDYTGHVAITMKRYPTIVAQA